MWQLYFTLWGVLVIVEGILKKILKSAGITIPPWLGWLYTNAVCESRKCVYCALPHRRVAPEPW